MLSIKKTGGSTAYALPLLTTEAIVRLQEWYDNGRFEDLVDPLHGHAAPALPAARVGSLVWPVVGASRYARATLVIDRYTLGLLRADLGTGNAVTLSYTDETGTAAETETARTFPMYLIASRPVSQCDTGAIPTTEPAKDDLWIVTLVDRRWYWVNEFGTGQLAAYAPATWAALLTVLFGRCLDAGSVTYDAVDSDYSTPGARWTGALTDSLSVAYLIDDACQCIGQRVAVTPDLVHVQNPSGANKTVLTDWHAARKADYRHGGGGLIDTLERTQGVPKVLYTVWPDDTTETVTAASGVASTNFYAWLDVPSAMSGGGRTAALGQWKDDFVAWQDTPLDAIYDGVCTVPDSAFLLAVEIYHDANTAYTRATAPPPCHQVITSKAFVAAASGGSLTVEEVDGSPSYTSITKIQFDQLDGFVVTNPSAGVARVDMPLTVEEADGSPSYTSIKTWRFDQDDGFAVTNPSAGVARIDQKAVWSRTYLTGSDFTVTSPSLATTGLSITLGKAGVYRLNAVVVWEGAVSSVPTASAEGLFFHLYESTTLGYVNGAFGGQGIIQTTKTCRFSGVVIDTIATMPADSCIVRLDAALGGTGATWTTGPTLFKYDGATVGTYLMYQRIGDA